MQHATVLYLADAHALPTYWDEEGALAEAGLDPEWTEVAAPLPGYDSPQEAQLRLAVRGAGRIDAASGRYADGRLELGAARLRLQGRP